MYRKLNRLRDSTDRNLGRNAFMFAFAIMAIASALIQIRPFVVSPERFIGIHDAADLAMVARNIAEGNGAVVDSVWLLKGGGLPGNEVTHPEAYWSIYVAAFWGTVLQNTWSDETNSLIRRMSRQNSDRRAGLILDLPADKKLLCNYGCGSFYASASGYG